MMPLTSIQPHRPDSRALDKKERDQKQCERERTGQGRSQQHATDDKGENGGYQRPPEARCMSQPVCREESDDTADEKQPAEQDGDRQRR